MSLDASSFLPQGPYPPEWRFLERFLRVERAANRCEVCGAADLRPHPIDGVLCYVHVVHKRDAKTFRPEDLLVACAPCINAGRHRGASVPAAHAGVDQLELFAGVA